jgi:hypothetical protein
MAWSRVPLPEASTAILAAGIEGDATAGRDVTQMRRNAP